MKDITTPIEQQDYHAVRHILSNLDTLEIEEILVRCEKQYRAIAFRLLPKNRALEVFEQLDPVFQQEILTELREPVVREILENMEADDRARLFDEMPPEAAKRLLEGLSLKERRLTSLLLGYPENSVGRIMSPEFVDLKVSMSVKEAISRVRTSGRGVEAINSLPVVNENGTIADVINLGDLVLADPQQRIQDLISEETYYVRVDEDQEKASRLLLETGYIALPVVDNNNNLIGVLTYDDAMDVLQERDTEDIIRSGASEPLWVPYLNASIFMLTKNRGIWLLVLAVAATLTVNVLNIFQNYLQSAIQLSLFIPLLIGIGGNIGSQSATIIIRAMALDEVRFSDLITVFFKEIRVGMFLGTSLGLIALLPVGLIFNWDISIVLGLSLISISTLAAVAGSVLPMTAKRIGIDPAVVSAPIISTLVDASGLIIYFLIARAVLGGK
ncbi:MAG TPA: magnesium transporter [Chitinispirillaceae bacterium]|nr:magnesium transporter [Chitinispirillaceae bacterium]